MNGRPTPPTIDTPRLRLRALTTADAAFLIELLNDPDFLAQIGDRGVHNAADAERYLREGPSASWAAHGHGLLAVELRESATPIGICGLLRRPELDAPDLGYALLPAHRGCGYVIEAARAVLLDGENRLGITRVLAITTPGNLASARVLEKLGFHRCGTHHATNGESLDRFERRPASDAPRDLAGWLRHIEQVHPQAIALGLDRVRVVAEAMQLAACRTLAGRAANPSARPIFPPVLDRERQLSACEPAKIWPRAAEFSPRPPKPDRLLGRPARHVISVAGTNGKGSTVAFLAAIAGAAGLRVGTYTSPHLLRYNERVHIDGREADDDALAAAFARVEAARGSVPLTYFEFGTLAALDLFSRAGLDLAVLEVGLGGRLDAVNLIDADCAIVTSVDLDHQALLGADRETIGFEKAGILRSGRPAVLAEIDPPASVLRHAYAIGAFAIRAGCDYHVEADATGWRWRELNETLTLPHPALAAPAQRHNAAAAIAALRALDLPIPEAAIVQGVRDAHVPGRLERHRLPAGDGAIELVLDIGHNPQAAAQIAQWIEDAPARRTHAVFAALADKDIAGILTPLQTRIEHWHLAGLTAESPRGLSGEALHARCVPPLQAARCSHYPDVATAIANAQAQLGDGDRLLVFGSFFTVAAAFRVLHGTIDRS